MTNKQRIGFAMLVVALCAYIGIGIYFIGLTAVLKIAGITALIATWLIVGFKLLAGR